MTGKRPDFDITVAVPYTDNEVVARWQRLGRRNPEGLTGFLRPGRSLRRRPAVLYRACP